MKNRLLKSTSRAAAVFAVMYALIFYVYAGMGNPATGDIQGKYFGVIVAVLAVSLVVIIVIAVMSSKKKK